MQTLFEQNLAGIADSVNNINYEKNTGGKATGSLKATCRFDGAQRNQSAREGGKVGEGAEGAYTKDILLMTR